jgi:23S rRNA pseudouridine1911/1915/1917 synthase
MNSVGSRLLYVSGECLVVNKLSGEAVEGARPGIAELPRLLQEALAARGEPLAHDELSPPVAAHRLDVPVSGCVVFARTPRSLRLLNAAFAHTPPPAVPAITKQYWAIVEPPPGAPPGAAGTGEPFPGTGELVHWLRFDSRKNKTIAFNAPGPGRKQSALRYRLLGTGRNYWFLAIELVTGRRHQIRAQLAALGLPIKGDLKYGARRSEKLGGIRLHARSITFPDPAAPGGRITVVATPPLQDNLWQAFHEAAPADSGGTR